MTPAVPVPERDTSFTVKVGQPDVVLPSGGETGPGAPSTTAGVVVAAVVVVVVVVVGWVGLDDEHAAAPSAAVDRPISRTYEHRLCPIALGTSMDELRAS